VVSERETATATREQALLDVVRRHFQAEEEQDIPRTLDTLTDDIVYEHPFYDEVLSGKAAVEDYYRRSWGQAPFQRINFLRHWISGDDTVVVEVEAFVGHTGETPRRLRTLAICTIRDGKFAREIVCSGGPRRG
jgi:ketosteroid isomerase-like protein